MDALRSHNPDDIAEPTGGFGTRDMVEGYSIEVMPRTAAKVDDFRALLPEGTRVYIANIEGTPFEDMLATARRLRDLGYPVMPHFPARMIENEAMLEAWLRRMRDDAGVDEALVIAGGGARPRGDLYSSMQMLKTGLFDKYGFTRLHVAGHPEGNRDIDADGGSAVADEALMWKQDFSRHTDADMAIVTQFFFDAQPVIDWVERLDEIGVTLPVHVGVAGPTRLQTLMKFALACGVGPSVNVLRKRATDVRKLLLPHEPAEVLTALAGYKAAHPGSALAKVHFFPLGGIKASANWANETVASAKQGAA